MKSIKKCISIFLTIILVVSVSTIFVSASTPPLASRWAFITESQSKAYSESVTGTYKVFGGTNYSNSEHNMTICSQYKDGNDWKYDKKIKVAINQTLNDTYTTFFDEEISWRVYLKPYGAYLSGCNGEGYIWYDM